jgi:phosphotriesterase-related protein
MAVINSATGPIESESLGFTLMHEHVMVSWPAIQYQYPQLLDREADLAKAVARLSGAVQNGVKTIVDLTPIDLGRDARFIAEASRLSGMQVIVATGVYYQRPFYFMGRPDAEIAEFFIRDIVEGISDTGVKAGVLKAASEPAVDPMNERILRATARAHRVTGVPICTHSYPANRTGLDQQRIFKEEGVDPSRTVIGHSDDTDDISYLDEIIQGGSYCGMDRIGLQAPRTSAQRAAMVTALVERGYASRITLSHDHPCVFHWAPPGIELQRPEWRLTHIPQDFIPMLRERGVSDDAIQQMTVRNPAALFGATTPYPAAG